MKIRLVDVDSKIPNIALMKLSAYHKAQGDDVAFYNPMLDKDRVDLLYASKVFSDTPDYLYYPDCPTIKAGSGYDLKAKLPEKIEHCQPDYGIYKSDAAMGFCTRGCIRNCKFCIVPEKEGHIQAVADIYEFWTGQKQLMLMDNNLTAMPDYFERIVKQCIKEKVRVDFSQGLDIRLINADMAKLLSKTRTYKQIHFAWDDIHIESAVRKGIDTLEKNGVKKYRLMFYVLIGFNSTPEEDRYRVETLHGLGVDPFVMPFDRTDEYQRNFTRWVNHKATFKTIPFEDYTG